jgi:hypothetical protein
MESEILLRLDFAKSNLSERYQLVQAHLPDVEFKHVASGRGYLSLKRPLETFSTGEQALIKMVQSPQAPVDLSLFDEGTARDVWALLKAFWDKQLYGR